MECESYTFGECTVDLQRRTVCRGGQLIHLRPKVFQLLVYLLEQRDRVVPKQELCEQVWPNTHISGGALESTISGVRQAVGDSGRKQEIIQTSHGHGYRFVAPVIESNQAPDDVPTLTLPQEPPPSGVHATEHQQLTLYMTLGTSLMSTKGYAAPETGHVYAQAQELSNRVGDTIERFEVLGGLAVFHRLRGELQAAHELGTQLLSLAHHLQDSARLLEARQGLGQTLLFLGELGLAREHLERGTLPAIPEQSDSQALLYGREPRLACFLFLSVNLWLLGYPTQARKWGSEALALARQSSHPFSLSFAHGCLALLHLLCREASTTQEHAEAAIRAATEQGSAFWTAGATVMQGWALVVQGQGEDGVEQLYRGLAAWRDTGAEMMQPYYLALLAEGYWQRGHFQDGLDVLAEALELINKTRECWWEAEIYRLQGGLLLLAECDQSTPEECFRQAIDISQRQQAKSLELRATTSLSRLWRQQGRCRDARLFLVDVYSWFAEGFDTADFREAKALIDALT